MDLHLTCATVDTWEPERQQQYLDRRPYGYRCHASTGVLFPNDS